jgi:hypothetical protein
MKVAVSVDPAAGGDIEVDLAYELGELAKLKSVPASGYALANWTENGVAISADASFTLASDAPHALVANFLLQPGLRLTEPTPGIPSLAWPADATGWDLQECSDLTSGLWTNSVRPLTLTGAQWTVTFTPSAHREFFRLLHR